MGTLIAEVIGYNVVLIVCSIISLVVARNGNKKPWLAYGIGLGLYAFIWFGTIAKIFWGTCETAIYAGTLQSFIIAIIFGVIIKKSIKPQLSDEASNTAQIDTQSVKKRSAFPILIVALAIIFVITIEKEDFCDEDRLSKIMSMEGAYYTDFYAINKQDDNAYFQLSVEKMTKKEKKADISELFEEMDWKKQYSEQGINVTEKRRDTEKTYLAGQEVEVGLFELYFDDYDISQYVKMYLLKEDDYSCAIAIGCFRDTAILSELETQISAIR